MKEDEHWWAQALGAGVLTVLLASLALVAAGGWTWFANFLSGPASNWAQAISAVVAIAAAYKIGRTQIAADRVLEDSRRAKEDLRRLTATKGILDSYYLSLRFMRDILEKYDPPIFNGWGFEERIEDGISSIKAIDLFECPSPSAISILAQLPRSSANLLASLNAYCLACDEGKAEAMRKLPNLHNSFFIVISLLEQGTADCQRGIDELAKP